MSALEQLRKYTESVTTALQWEGYAKKAFDAML
jgi:hypothetical protein